MDAEPPGLVMLDEFAPMREALRGLVAALVEDGFSDEQARALVVHMMVTVAPPPGN